MEAECSLTWTPGERRSGWAKQTKKITIFSESKNAYCLSSENFLIVFAAELVGAPISGCG